MTRIPAVDMEDVEHYLRQHNVRSVWTTISFVYPLLFETGETLAVSNAIFESPYRVYPKQIPWREPDPEERFAIVIESDSSFHGPVEARLQQVTGVAPVTSQYGKLTIVARGTP